MTDQHTQHTDPEQVAFARQRANALRSLADFIEDKPELAGAYSNLRILVSAGGEDEMARLVRQLGGARTKEGTDKYLCVVRDFGADVAIEVFTHREEVCEAVVVGTETVEIPDPDVDVPTITVERDVIRWECSPVLSQAVAS